MDNRTTRLTAIVPRQPPKPALIVARGAGWGAALGFGAGLLLPTATELALDGGAPSIAASITIGLLVAPITMFFGLAAGIAAAICCLPLVSTRRAHSYARLVSATVGPIVVVGMSIGLFSPSFEVGPNQTSRHLEETILIFVAFPAIAACLAGLVLGSRLVTQI